MLRTCVLTILSIVLASSLSTSVASSSVIISEIMYNPAGTDFDEGAATPYNREWVELYNSGLEAVDLSGWQLGDSEDGDFTSPFPTGTTLGPQQAIVVTGDGATFESQWGRIVNRVDVDSFPTLDNSPTRYNETLALRDQNGLLRDLVNFAAGEYGWFKADGSHGQSIFALPQGLDPSTNNSGANWRPASWGAYGARFRNVGGNNSASPGVVVTETQAPFAPSAGVAWSMVVIPDTQNYAKNSADLPVLDQMLAWIKDNREEYKVQIVLQEGDIVNQNDRVTPTSGNQSSQQQWTNVRNSFSTLNGVLPYIMAVGNHDMGTTSAQTRQTYFNDYFKAEDNPLIDPAQGGMLQGTMEPGRLENAYFDFVAPDGRKMLIFSLEFWPREATVTWANQIAALPEYADYTATLLTHSYMNWNERRTDATPDAYPIGDDANDGEELWNELVKLNGNFEMTFSGHVGGDGIGYLKSEGDQGNAVHQMLINTQFEASGGNGWVRLLEFLDDGKTVHVRTYSPYLNMYRTDPANDFFINLTPLPPVEYAAADFNRDGFVDGDDLTVWQANFGVVGTATVQAGDADGDLDVDGADYLLWQQQFTGSALASPSQAAVPEPSALLLAIGGASLVASIRRRAMIVR